MALVHLGAVEYLNARPLVYGLDRSPRFSLRFDVPSRCADLLHAGTIDLGLIPSIEYLRPPSRGVHYAIVPDLAIASRGKVASVCLYSRRPVSEVRSIALDTSSRTSIALVRVLCARVFHVQPAFEARGPNLAEMLTRADAALIIGDNALLQEGGVIALPGESGAPSREVDVEKIDLGEVWTGATGLPFVYAFWAGREGRLSVADVEALRHARDQGVDHPEEIAGAYFPGAPGEQAIGVRYLRDNIKYALGPDERAGLERFFRYAAEAGVVERATDLRFYGHDHSGHR